MAIQALSKGLNSSEIPPSFSLLKSSTLFRIFGVIGQNSKFESSINVELLDFRASSGRSECTRDRFPKYGGSTQNFVVPSAGKACY